MVGCRTAVSLEVGVAMGPALPKEPNSNPSPQPQGRSMTDLVHFLCHGAEMNASYLVLGWGWCPLQRAHQLLCNDTAYEAGRA